MATSLARLQRGVGELVYRDVERGRTKARLFQRRHGLRRGQRLASELVAGDDEDLPRLPQPLPLRGLRLVVGRQLRALAEEVLLRLIEEDLVACSDPPASRYSFMIILKCSSHSFHASCETLS